jgi:tRNA-splicing ligase RtcB (3'-phosphate/5'-hydroxy nucleic acid ligase)
MDRNLSIDPGTMSKLNLSGKMLRNLGFPQGPVIRTVIDIFLAHHKKLSNEEAADILKSILSKPGRYLEHPVYKEIAYQLIPPPKDESFVDMAETAVPYEVFGKEFIEPGAFQQMSQAVRLPVAVAGALMPDAHHGYGLPIGGVLAVENAVIPYGVGVDIGCRMCLSVFNISPTRLDNTKEFNRLLNEHTVFGAGNELSKPEEHEILDDPLFRGADILRPLQGKALRQVGTSGSGNHFVEFGELIIEQEDQQLGIKPGTYVALLSHSGSRALGATIASHFTSVAKAKRKLPGEAANLAWLGLDEEDGALYWQCMNLAGKYASACHHIIHRKIASALGEAPLKVIENHHNFAWEEELNGKRVIVHRKGATPAGKNVLGIIPGSMTAPGFIVKGKGSVASINSASHGAGRKLSRTAAISMITRESMDQELLSHNVSLIGGGLDESPFAYKNINDVMNSQSELVDTVGKFLPRIVRMDAAPHKSWKKKK